MAYPFVPFPMTLDDLEGQHSCDGFNCHGASRGPSAIAELLVTFPVLARPDSPGQRAVKRVCVCVCVCVYFVVSWLN